MADLRPYPIPEGWTVYLPADYSPDPEAEPPMWRFCRVSPASPLVRPAGLLRHRMAGPHLGGAADDGVRHRRTGASAGGIPGGQQPFQAGRTAELHGADCPKLAGRPSQAPLKSPKLLCPPQAAKQFHHFSRPP